MTFPFGLPNEVWINILGNLDQEDLLSASLVSKQLRELALDPDLWKDLRLTEDEDEDEDEDEEDDGVGKEVRYCLERCLALFDRCKKLQTLEIKSGNSLAMIEAMAEYAIRNCKQISRLKISAMPKKGELFNFSMELFQTLEEHGRNIKELDFKEVNIKSGDMLQMPTVLGRLTSVTLAQGNEDYNEGSHHVPGVLQTLGSHCSNLRQLDLEQYSMSDPGDESHSLPGFYKEDVEVLLSGVKATLISLKLGFVFDEPRDAHQVEHSSFIHCTLLEKLHVAYSMDAKDMMAIGRLRHLKELTIETSDRMDPMDEDYQKAFKQKQLINLQQVKLNGDSSFGKKAMIAMLQNCPNLTSLSCNLYPDSHHGYGVIHGLSEVVANSGPHAISLEKLDLNVPFLHQKEFIALTSLCNLRELKISGFGIPDSECFVYDLGVTTLPRGNLVNLEVLTLRLCSNLDNTMFKALVEGSPKLLKIDLNTLPKVSRCAEICMECGLKNLKTFRAANCPGLRFRGGLAVLRQSCPKIKTFCSVQY
jgi:hypothetical protein